MSLERSRLKEVASKRVSEHLLHVADSAAVREHDIAAQSTIALRVKHCEFSEPA
eukprot:CAMPEP_0181295876 /NCGR_PEP_ID=MMETSP1101-20121128/4387_1 /TAXON_ID=46948 /ORGANISM="Rhodomonas abbreviata, Strain Caron Lab Isolate" /LENGTH=53 /DNA_ID=CAMNT_0023400669 /DNA_START=359 /DNA_END=516 /DNA_ORIENTATION=+